MKKTRYLFVIVIAIISICMLTGCAQETGSVNVTVIPENAGEQNTVQPAPSNAASALPAVPEETQFPLGEITDETFTADVNSDGVEETVSFNGKEIESGGGVDYLTVMTVSGGSETYTENIEGSMYASCYFIRTQSGKVCLLVSLEGFVDSSSEIYIFDGIKPVRLCGLGHITGVSGADITEEGAVEVFGTWHYSQTIKLNDDLSLEYGEYRIIMDDRTPLLAVKKLPVEFLENGVYTKGYVDKGKDIFPVSTDGKSYFKFRLEDGAEGRILYTEKDGQYEDGIIVHFIDGKSEYEYLGNIEYTDMVY